MWFEKIHNMAIFVWMLPGFRRHILCLRDYSRQRKTIAKKNRRSGGSFLYSQRISRLDRYFLTISATLKMMAWSNSRRSRPVSFLIFSRR